MREPCPECREVGAHSTLCPAHVVGRALAMILVIACSGLAVACFHTLVHNWRALP